MEVDREPKQQRRAGGANGNTNGPRKRPSRALRQQQQPKPEESVDDSAWIHRDKLAQIEIQEMEQAGMHVRQPHRSDSISQMRSASRATSRTGMRRSQSKDQIALPDEQLTEQEKKRVSTIHAADEEDADVEMHPGFNPELRTPEEVAAEQYAHRQHTVRPSTSRIPISKTSPLPVNGVITTESPRSRSGSNAFPTSWDDLQYAKRLRSNSVGSGVLLDDPEYTERPPSGTNRNVSAPLPQAQTPTKSKTKATVRKPLNDVTNGKAQTNSRPPSSQTRRPSTSHSRPEGEAPWIASMYKPDPMLPPDEQIIPTHAKKMQQEKWEKEGKIGNIYDRDLRLLNDDEIKRPPVPSKSPERPETAEPVQEKENADPDIDTTASGRAWPIVNDTIRVESPRPSTSGGYRTTPTIRQSSSSLRTGAAVKPAATEPAVQQHIPRMQEYDEKHDSKAKKGCCCIIM